MKVQYMPQVCGLPKPEYAFKGEKVTVTLDGETVIYHLADCAQGQYLEEPQEVNGQLTLVSVRRENGDLLVELFMPIGEQGTEAERFPEAFEPEESTLPKGKAVKPVFVSPPEPEMPLDEKVATLEEELLMSYEAQAELFEQTLIMQEENLMMMEGLASVFEMILGGE